MSDHPIPEYPIPTVLAGDPVLREFYPEFVERWLADLTTQWPAVVERADPTELYRFGHTIKGSFIQFGLRDLSDVGRHVMACTDPLDWTKASACVEGLRRTLLQFQSILPSLLERSS
ncbi:MAG: hypothetical protein MUC47_08905 [Candidatus Kapabacteria bacterium]|nr:hypothetical protein [Candidatus Kapabacteria bacterium]